MLQLIGNRLYNVPVPQITARALLIRVELALVWSPVPRAERRSRLSALWRRYPNAARKWVDYVWHEGLRSTVVKTRAQLDTLRINDVGRVASVYGRVEAVGEGVSGFSVGDPVAGYGFERPAYAEYLLLPAAWCYPVTVNEVRSGAALLPGLYAMRFEEPVTHFAEILRGGDQTARIDPDRYNISLYSDQPVYEPFTKSQVEDYFKGAAAFDGVLQAIPEMMAKEAGQIIQGGTMFVASPHARSVASPHPKLVASPHPKSLSRGRGTSKQKASFPGIERKGNFGLSLIGAGNYPRSLLLPAVAGLPGVSLRGVADLNAAAAAIAAERFPFAFATTDVNDIFNDLATRGIIVTTYHDTHALLAIRALERGIAAFIEKPPVTSREQLTALVETYERKSGFLAVGYNRRFAPGVLRLRALLTEEHGPRTLVCLVQGSVLPPTHWYGWARQGSRIAGNACHWIDLCCVLTNQAVPVAVYCTAPPGTRHAENISITITFEDGSLATIIFTDRGDGLRGVQEMIEVRCGDLSATLSDGLDRLVASRAGRVVARWQGKRDKGHAAEMKAVIEAMQHGKPAPVSFREVALSSLLMLAAVEALETGQPILIDNASLKHYRSLQ